MLFNGKEVSLDREMTINQFLTELDVNINRVVVELNKEIVLKNDFGKISLKDSDSVEVVSFVGGG